MAKTKKQEFIDQLDNPNGNPKEEKKEPIPPYDYSLNHTHFHKKWSTLGTAVTRYVNLEVAKFFGQKTINDEGAHKDEIGKNIDVCRKLYGLGNTLKEQGIKGFNLGSLENHVWIPQVNLKDGEPMRVCLNCGSLMLNGRFIAYTDLK